MIDEPPTELGVISRFDFVFAVSEISPATDAACGWTFFKREGGGRGNLPGFGETEVT